MPPPLTEPESASTTAPAPACTALRAWKRAINFARASAVVLVALAALSALVNILHPLSPHFLISILALANGLVEWRGARALAALDRRAPSRLALNQLVLGAGILAYGWWQARVMTPALAREYLDRPLIRPLLASLPPEELGLLHDLLPPMLALAYSAAGIGGALGCWAVALYYRSRRRHVDAAAIALAS